MALQTEMPAIERPSPSIDLELFGEDPEHSMTGALPDVLTEAETANGAVLGASDIIADDDDRELEAELAAAFAAQEEDDAGSQPAVAANGATLDTVTSPQDAAVESERPGVQGAPPSLEEDSDEDELVPAGTHHFRGCPQWRKCTTRIVHGAKNVMQLLDTVAFDDSKVLSMVINTYPDGAVNIAVTGHLDPSTTTKYEEPPPRALAMDIAVGDLKEATDAHGEVVAKTLGTPKAPKTSKKPRKNAKAASLKDVMKIEDEEVMMDDATSNADQEQEIAILEGNVAETAAKLVAQRAIANKGKSKRGGAGRKTANGGVQKPTTPKKKMGRPKKVKTEDNEYV